MLTTRKTDPVKVASICDAMLQLQQTNEATRENIKTVTGLTDTDLDINGDAARAMAHAKATSQTRARVPARKAA